MKDILILSWFWNSLEYKGLVVGGLIVLLTFAMFCFCSWIFKFDGHVVGFMLLIIMSVTLFPLLSFFLIFTPLVIIGVACAVWFMYSTHKKISKLGVDK